MKRNDRDFALAIYIYYRLSKSWCDMHGISIGGLYEYLIDFKELIKKHTKK
jgi:hypothetical protein